MHYDRNRYSLTFSKIIYLLIDVTWNQTISRWGQLLLFWNNRLSRFIFLGNKMLSRLNASSSPYNLISVEILLKYLSPWPKLPFPNKIANSHEARLPNRRLELLAEGGGRRQALDRPRTWASAETFTGHKNKLKVICEPVQINFTGHVRRVGKKVPRGFSTGQ